MMGNGDLERGAAATKDRNQTSYDHQMAEYSDSQWTSWLVPMIIVANVAMFVAIMFVNNCPSNQHSNGDCVARFLGRLSFQPLRENPLFGPSSSTLEKLGALDWNKIVHENQAWRLITCIWLHAGVIHLLANMLSLVFIGIRLEQQFGFVRVGLIYLLSGIGGSILSALFIQKSISVGASGALFGLLGAMLSELFTNWTIYTNKAGALITLIVIIAINLAVGILPHVDNYAHIGGFMTGFLSGFVLLVRPRFGWLDNRHRPSDTRLKSKYTVYQYVFWLVSAILLIVGRLEANPSRGGCLVSYVPALGNGKPADVAILDRERFVLAKLYLGVKGVRGNAHIRGGNGYPVPIDAANQRRTRVNAGTEPSPLPNLVAESILSVGDLLQYITDDKDPMNTENGRNNNKDNQVFCFKEGQPKNITKSKWKGKSCVTESRGEYRLCLGQRLTAPFYQGPA
ncbi:inactive rhomboid protein 1 [Phtheirospermum japonicum]|uniref:RHOMBOID-like protein n=1 Tax=Phtheirospermum japonicum TaxID=374723 RepID=A0A830BDG4_9LAMI|nr:inactive rhomboid protein 1 [Phtheirospermum japonicum]